VRAPRATAGLLAVLLCLGLVTAGCSKDTKPRADPKKVLAAAKRNLDTTSGVRIGLKAGSLPTGVNGLLAADGVGTHAPAFRGTIKVSVSGVNADAAVVATAGKVYAKLPFTTSFAVIDPADYGAPDPADLLANQGGLSSMLTSARNVQQGAQVRDGKRVLTRYTATVPGTTMASIIPSARASARFDATFTIDDRNRLAKAVLRGPFYPKADDVRYTVTFDDYGLRRHITAP
jgi:lipoprotein LprG